MPHMQQVEEGPDMLALALAYEAAGLTVMPPKQDGSKRPFADAWKAYQAREPMRSELRAWYRQGLTGIGTVTGAISDNLELFEFDWYDTYLSFGELAEAAGLGELVERIRNGYSEKTPGGGIHWYYRCETIDGNTKLASRPDPKPDNPRGVKVLIETRGEGGYAVMAPSYGSVHPTGAPYEVLLGSVDTIATITPEERAALWQLARSFDQMPERRPLAPSPVHEPTGDRPGDLFSARTSWGDILKPAGWAHVYRKGGTDYWRRPGKSFGISASTNHSGNDTLMVFSTSTEFEAVPASYSKFAAFALINHGGDFAAAGKDLWSKGYKEEPKGSRGVVLEWTGKPNETLDEETGEIVEVTPFTNGRVLIGELLANGIEPPEWLVEPVLVRGKMHLCYGEPESGKTILALSWLLQVIEAGETVLFIDEESGKDSITKLMGAMGAEPAVDSGLFYYPFLGLTKADADATVAKAEEIHASLIIFDSLTDMLAAAGIDENDGVQVTDWFNHVAQRLARLPLAPAVVLIDHVTKDTGNVKYSVASRAKKSKSDVLWYIERTAEFDQSKTAAVDLVRQKNRPGVLPKKVRYIVGGRDGMLVCEPFEASRSEISSLHPKAQQMLDELTNAYPEALSPGTLALLMDVKRTSVWRHGETLIRRGLVERSGLANQTIYSLTEAPKSFHGTTEVVSGNEVKLFHKVVSLPPSLGGNETTLELEAEPSQTEEEDDHGWN